MKNTIDSLGKAGDCFVQLMNLNGGFASVTFSETILNPIDLSMNTKTISFFPVYIYIYVYLKPAVLRDLCESHFCC